MDFNIYVNNTALANVSTYQVGWYDVSKDSGRDTTTADGSMILNVISQKYRIDITTTYMNNTELATFFSQIASSPTMMVKFYDPYSASVQEVKMYRGDRNTQIRFTDSTKAMFEPVTIALIQL